MNKIIIKGRLTRDPETKVVGGGIEICKFCVAVDRRKAKDKEKVTDFFDCTAFGQTGAAIKQYMSKGREILVEGRMESNTVDKEGLKTKYWGITVDTFEFCGSRQDAASAAAQEPSDPSGFTPVETDELPF